MNELENLASLLIGAGLPFWFRPHPLLPKHYQICFGYPNKPPLDDVVFGPYTNGFTHGLLESYHFDDKPLTADEVFVYWKKLWRKKSVGR